MTHNYVYQWCSLLIIIGNNGSASRHPVGHSFHPISQPRVTQPGIAQPRVAQPGVTQSGVMQPGVAQPGVTQPGVTQPGVTQPGIAQLGVTQPGVAPLGSHCRESHSRGSHSQESHGWWESPSRGVMTQQQVVQQRAPQLHNVPQHMTADFQMSHSKFYNIL